MSDLATHVSDFDAFCRQGLGRAMRPYQMAPAEAVIASVLGREGRTIAVLMARQSGKNELMACLSLWLALRVPGIKIGMYAPTLPQATDIAMRRVKRHLRRLTVALRGRRRPAGRRSSSGVQAPSRRSLKLPLGPLCLPSTEVDRRDLVELAPVERPTGPLADRGEGSLLGAHSAERGAQKEGYTWDLILYDEAQRLSRAVVDEEIAPMGAATAATEVFIGTPYSVDCKLYDVLCAIREGRVEGVTFEYPCTVVSEYVPEYARFVEKKARELGRESVAFRTQYALEWVQGLGMFFEFDVFRTLALPNEEFLSCRPPDAALESDPGHATPAFAVGVDLAGDDPRRTGRTDFTAIAVVRRDGDRKTLVDLHSWRGKSWEQQFRDIVRLVQALPGRVQVAVDATGMGDPFSDRLQKALVGRPVAVERVKLTAASKSEVGLYAEQEVAGERVFYAAGPETRAGGRLDEFLHQIRWLAREHLPDKAVRWYVSPERGHDDLVCAFFLALWAARRSPVRRLPMEALARVDAIEAWS